jgi:hypothetical protein
MATFCAQAVPQIKLAYAYPIVFNDFFNTCLVGENTNGKRWKFTANEPSE